MFRFSILFKCLKNTVVIVLIVIIFLSWEKHVLGLSCSDVKKTGSGSKYSLKELETLSDDAFMSCLVYLGRDPLEYQEGKYIWARLLEMHENDIWNIPEQDLQQMGWIMKVISPREIRNLTLADISTISAFGQYHNLSQTQLQALAEKVREDWSAKDPVDYTFYDLMALNHILCGFNATDLAEIHPDSYKEAANVLSTLRDCSREALQTLASLAMSPSAFDEPSTWYSSQVRSVGCVLNGMSRDEISSIPAEGFESLMPEIIECLSQETFKSMTPYQLKRLTPSAAAAITNAQKSLLDFAQRRSISEAYTGEIKKKDGTGSNNGDEKNLKPSRIFLWAVLITTLV